MNLELLLLLLLAYAIGALPLGYWAARVRGVETLRAAPYNIGFENALRVLGEPAVVIGFVADFLKGAFTVGLVAGWEGNAAGLMAGFAGFVGHLWPPAFLFPRLYAVRGRGNVFLLGVMGGLTVFAGMPFWVAALPVIVWAAVLGYWRFVSLATLSGLLMLTLIVVVSPVDALGRWAVLLLLSAATWRFKENLGRIIDRTEPRVGEVHHVAGERNDQVVTAFFIHALTIEDFFISGRLTWLEPIYKLGWISAPQLIALGKLVRPFKIGELRGIYTSDGKEIICYLLSTPVLPQMFKDDPEFCKARAIQAARLAHELGANTFGLGAFWGTVGKKGLEVQAAVPEIHVTNGGAYTAGSIRAAVPEIIRHFAARGENPKNLTAAVLGANGVVAFGMARMVAPEVGKVILIGRDLERLEKSAATLRKAHPDTRFVSSVTPHDCIEADLIFSATSDPLPVIFAKDVKPGAWIYDEGRPADADESVLSVPGVRLIPGGVVQPPGGMYDANGWAKGKLKFGRGNVPACLAETLIIAANQCWDRVSLGETTRTENINYFVREAERLGFTVLESIDAPAVPLETMRSSDGIVH